MQYANCARVSVVCFDVILNICRRKNSGECSTKTQKQQQTPGIFRQMFHKTAKTTTNAGNFPANVPKTSQNNNKRRRKNSRKCSKKKRLKRSRGLRRARYETRVGSPPDFQPKRVSAPSCLRALRFERFGRSSRKCLQKTKKPPVSRTPLVASTKPEATHSTKPHKTTTTLDCEEKKFGKTVQQATAHATKHQFQQPYTLETVR